MERGLLDHVRSVGDHLERRLRSLALKHPVIVEVRGAGLMRGVELRVDATAVVDLARERGLLVNRTNEKVVRLLPPLTITAADTRCRDRHPGCRSGGSPRRGARMSTAADRYSTN